MLRMERWKKCWMRFIRSEPCQERKKESVPISARIEKRTFERLEKFCEDSGLGKTVTLERALNMYMDEYYGEVEITKR